MTTWAGKLTDARIRLRDVGFAYRADEPVLNRMSFVAEPGKVTALVGPSGGSGRRCSPCCCASMK